MATYLLLALVLLVMRQCRLGSCFGTPLPGSLDTAYNLFYVGENITLHCRKKAGNFIGTPSFRKGNRPISNEYVTVINTTYVRLDEPVTGQNDAEVSSYQCLDNGALVASHGPIYTDYRPTNATDFHLIWWNRALLYMDWRFGNISFKNSHTDKVIKVAAEWSLNGDQPNSTWVACNETSNTTCNVTNSNPFAEVTLRVTICNVRRNDSVVTTFPALPVKDHVKPRPVRSMRVRTLSSRSVEVKVVSDWPEQIYNVTYCTANDVASPCSVWISDFTSHTQFEIGGLHPNYGYTFGVQTKFQEGYLSDSHGNDLDHNIIMPEDVPSSAPEITPGAFYTDHTACLRSPTTTSTYLYFQTVPKEDQNGILRKYTAEMATASGSLRVFHQYESVRTIRLDRVPCGERFNVLLYASTDVGPSPFSILSVPAWNRTLHGYMVVLDLKVRVLQNGSVTAEWNTSPDTMQHFRSLFVYYCEGDPANNDQCQKAIQYEEVDPKTGQQHLMSARGNMKFGMAAVTHLGTTTGIHFTQCLYDPDLEADVSPAKVYLSRQGDGVLVSWTGVARCSTDRRVVILQYSIIVCPLPLDEECDVYSVKGSTKSLKLTNLSTDKDYNVSVETVTTSAKPSSGAVTAVLYRPQQAARGSLDGGEIAGIVFAAMVVVTVLGALIFCYCKGMIRRRKKLFEKKLITHPQPKKFGIEGPHASLPDISSTLSDDKSLRSSMFLEENKPQSGQDSGFNSQSQDSSPVSPLSGTQPAFDSFHPAGIAAVATDIAGQDPGIAADTKAGTGTSAAVEESPCVNEITISDEGSEKCSSQQSSMLPYVRVTGVCGETSSDASFNADTESDSAWLVGFDGQLSSFALHSGPPAGRQCDGHGMHQGAGDAISESRANRCAEQGFADSSRQGVMVEGYVLCRGLSQTVPKTTESSADCGKAQEESCVSGTEGLSSYVTVVAAGGSQSAVMGARDKEEETLDQHSATTGSPGYVPLSMGRMAGSLNLANTAPPFRDVDFEFCEDTGADFLSTTAHIKPDTEKVNGSESAFCGSGYVANSSLLPSGTPVRDCAAMGDAAQGVFSPQEASLSPYVFHSSCLDDVTGGNDEKHWQDGTKDSCHKTHSEQKEEAVASEDFPLYVPVPADFVHDDMVDYALLESSGLQPVNSCSQNAGYVPWSSNGSLPMNNWSRNTGYVPNGCTGPMNNCSQNTYVRNKGPAPVNTNNQNTGYVSNEGPSNNCIQNTGYVFNEGPSNNRIQNTGYVFNEGPSNNRIQNTGYVSNEGLGLMKKVDVERMDYGYVPWSPTP